MSPCSRVLATLPAEGNIVVTEGPMGHLRPGTNVSSPLLSFYAILLNTSGIGSLGCKMVAP